MATKFSNTPAGVVAMLNEETTLSLNLEDVETTPDPDVVGVWMVRIREPKRHQSVSRVVAYLAGYPDPHGRVREDNDFEMEEV